MGGGRWLIRGQGTRRPQWGLEDLGTGMMKIGHSVRC